MANEALWALFAGAMEGGDIFCQPLHVLCILLGYKSCKSFCLSASDAGESFEECDEVF